MKKHLLLPAILILLLQTFSFAQCPSWTQKSNFGGTARSEAVGFSIGTKGYIGTGNGGGYKQDFWQWDQSGNVWTQEANFGGTARMGAVGFSIGTKGYIGTGTDAVGLAQDFWEWDQGTNVWTLKANFGGTARTNAVGFSIGTKGYIGTGSTSSGVTSDFWEWDQATNVWTQKTNFGGTARCYAVGFSIGTKGCIGTGSGNSSDFWEWDQATNTWTQKANFGGTARRGAVGFSIGTKGYIGTGDTTALNGGTQDFWEWDQATNVWIQIANFGGTVRRFAIGFSIGNKGYVGTGNLPPTNYQDFWEYQDSGSVSPISVCLATVDSFSTKNIIVWDKPVSTTIASFRIYRDSGTGYLPVVTQPYSSLSEYTDNVNPNIHSYDYKISEISTGGVESALSNRHETMFLQKSQTAPPAFNLTWTDYCGFPVIKYYIWRDGNNTNSWAQIDSVNFGTNVFIDSFPPSQSANYRIEAIDPQPCTVSLKNQIPIPLATTIKGTKSNTSYKVFGAGTNEYGKEPFSVLVYPNPCNGNFQLAISDSRIANEYKIKIYNLLGKLVYVSTINHAASSISLRDIASGVYHLQVSAKDGVVNRKIVIE